MVSLTVGAQISNILGFWMVKCVPVKYWQSRVPLRDSLSKRIANLCNLSRIVDEVLFVFYASKLNNYLTLNHKWSKTRIVRADSHKTV